MNRSEFDVEKDERKTLKIEIRCLVPPSDGQKARIIDFMKKK